MGGGGNNSQTLCGIPLVKVLRYWCIFDSLWCLIAIGLCIAFATTDDRNVRVTFGTGAVLGFFMMAADVILLMGLRNGHKLLILLWQIVAPLFAISTLALFQLGQAYALYIHPQCDIKYDGVRICNALVRLSLLFFGLSVICLLYYTLFFRYVHYYRKRMTSDQDQVPILPNREEEKPIEPEIQSSNPFE